MSDKPPPAAPPVQGWASSGNQSSLELASAEADDLQRLDNFEDFIEVEVGDTDLSRARHLERETGLRQIHLKFEGSNPSGTQKDRIAFAQALDALRRGFDAITVATCGNYGAALALAAKKAGLRAVVHIPEGYRTRRVAEIEAAGAQIVWVDADYEGTVAMSQEQAAREELYDANPGGANTSLQLTAYGQIAYEIYDELRDAPAIVAVSVSNGTTLAGIYRGFLSLHRRGKTSRIPKMVAGSSSRQNPILEAYTRKLTTCEDLPPARIRETAVNEPLINWHSIDGDLALAAIRATEGWATGVSDRHMTELSRRLLREDGLSVLPAATAGLAALLKRQSTESLPGDRYVAILTGRRR